MKLTKNAAKCNQCGDVVESKHRHDFVSCTCGNLSVDGGLAYTRRCFGKAGYQELSEHSE